MSTNLMRTKHERSGGGVVFGKEEKHTKPWKYDKRYILTIFRWVLLNMDGHMKVCPLWLYSLHTNTLRTPTPSLYPVRLLMRLGMLTSPPLSLHSLSFRSEQFSANGRLSYRLYWRSSTIIRRP